MQAVSFWSLATSRQVLRSSLLPVLFTGAVVCYWRWVALGLADRQREARGRRAYVWLGLLALLVGASLYTYIPARVTWVVFPLFAVYLLIFHRKVEARTWLPGVLAVVAGLLLSAPLFLYLRSHPGAEQRLAMLDEPLRALRAGDISIVLGRLWSGLAGLVLPGRGDEFLAYNIPGRPLLDPLTGVLFLLGLLICVARWRRPAYALLLLWLVVGISPSLLTGATAGFTRSIAAQPTLFIVPAIAGVAAVQWAAAHWGRVAAWVVSTAIVALVVASGWVNVRDYFGVWGESPDVRAAYKHLLVEEAAYVDGSADVGVAALSSANPLAPHDPYVFHMSLRKEDQATRWFDGRRALLVPGGPTARLLAPCGVPLDPYLADLPGLHLREQIELRPDDLDPCFIVYDWTPASTREALRERVALPGTGPMRSITFGGGLQFVGYDLKSATVTPGGAVELATVWHVLDPAQLRLLSPADSDAELVFFVHLLDHTGELAGQEDRLDAPAWDWEAGDTVVQLHRFSARTDLQPGDVTLSVGVFRRASGERLPVTQDGQASGDHLVLQSVRVAE
ncbi:MAG: hypothetical protein GX601_17160, partial [Anaerolineales bacterium]|nr:hypothetical protein [Anaerolineales bacterium]